MKVYVLTVGPRDYEENIGVYASLELAKAAADGRIVQGIAPPEVIRWHPLGDGYWMGGDEWAFIRDFEVEGL